MFDNELIAEFGGDISLKTDFEKLLTKKDDYSRLVLLHQAILEAIKQMPEHEKVKQQCDQKRNVAYKKQRL